MSLIQEDRLWEIQQFMETKPETKMPTEIITTQNKNLTHPAKISVDITDESDLVLPSAIVLNPSSKLVMQGVGAPGDIIEASNYSLLCKKGEKIEIIPIQTYYDWTKTIKNAQDPSKRDFVARMAHPEISYDRNKWSTDEVDGIRYNKAVHMFAALTRDLDAVPVRFTFKGMAAGAGKKVSTHFQMSERFNLNPCRLIFTLSTVLATYKNNSSYALEFSEKGKATKEQTEKAEKWRETFGDAKRRVSVSEDVESEEVPF